jgi:CRISPR/Cas system-associated protein Cas7 (RAMP superfamily)
MNCLNCGAEVKQTPGKRAKGYCNSSCRQKHWLKNNKKESVRKPGRPRKSEEPEKKIDPVEIQRQIAELKEKYKDMPTFRGQETTKTFANDVEKMIWESEQEILSRKK